MEHLGIVFSTAGVRSHTPRIISDGTVPRCRGGDIQHGHERLAALYKGRGQQTGKQRLGASKSKESLPPKQRPVQMCSNLHYSPLVRCFTCSSILVSDHFSLRRCWVLSRNSQERRGVVADDFSKTARSGEMDVVLVPSLRLVKAINWLVVWITIGKP